MVCTHGLYNYEIADNYYHLKDLYDNQVHIDVDVIKQALELRHCKIYECQSRRYHIMVEKFLS